MNYDFIDYTECVLSLFIIYVLFVVITLTMGILRGKQSKE